MVDRRFRLVLSEAMNRPTSHSNESPKDKNCSPNAVILYPIGFHPAGSRYAPPRNESMAIDVDESNCFADMSSAVDSPIGL